MPSEKQLAAVKRLTKRIDNLRTANAELLEALEVTLEALECWKAECPDSWDVGDADAVATATGIIRKHKGK